MAEIKIERATKVGRLRKRFKSAFGLTLRVYEGRRLANDSVRREVLSPNLIPNKLVLKSKMTVKQVIQLFYESFGIDVNIADSKDKKLLDEDLTLKKAKGSKSTFWRVLKIIFFPLLIISLLAAGRK